MTEQTCTAEALNDLRQRYLAGKSWTRDELKDAIHTMIGQRLKDVQAAAAPKTKKTKAIPVSLDDMLPGMAPVIAAPVEEPEAVKPEAPKKPVNPSGSFF